MENLPERVFRLASVILAASDQVPVERAIIVAEKIVELLEEIRVYKHETEKHFDH